MIMNENTIPLHAQSMFIEIPKLLNQPPWQMTMGPLMYLSTISFTTNHHLNFLID